MPVIATRRPLVLRNVREPALFMLVVSGLAVLACSTNFARADEPAAKITLTNNLKFRPAKVTVKAGDVVEWRNTSVLVHTVTDDPKRVARVADYELPDGAEAFDSGKLKPEASFRHKFKVPGTYKYFCVPHEGAGMIAEVIVEK